MKSFDCIGFDSSDYWPGYHLPCLQFPVYESMTNSEIVTELRNELNSVFDMFEDIWDKEHDNMFNDYCDKLLESPDKIWINPQYEQELTEDEEPMYLYFSFVNPVTVGGLTFLDK